MTSAVTNNAGSGNAGSGNILSGLTGLISFLAAAVEVSHQLDTGRRPSADGLARLGLPADRFANLPA